MAITLASDALSDAAITDGIGSGDLTAAARLWVRHWPTALAASRVYVERDEVPGLAAEALIGTISMTATGRGPRENVSGFVAAAVRELGEDEEPPAADIGEHPEVYASPRMTRAFADLPSSAQQALRDLAHGEPDDEDAAPAGHALTVLQSSYLTTHLGDAPSRECRPAHVGMLAAVEGRSSRGFAGSSWLHMSTCAWCTEAFHEVAFSNTALDALIPPAVLFAAVVDDPLPPEVAEPALAAVVEEEESTEAAAEAHSSHRAGVHTLLRGGRNGVLVAAGLTAAAAVIALVLTQVLPGSTDDPATPTAATGAQGAQPTAQAFPTGGTDANILGSIEETPTAAPESTEEPGSDASVAGPLDLPTPTGSPDATRTPSPTRSPTTKPKPSSTPTPSDPSAPATSADPDPTPEPTPEPTPTAKPCNPLQHLLGFC